MTKLEEIREEFLDDSKPSNQMNWVERKPFTDDVYHGERGFRLTWNTISHVGSFYYIVPDFLLDVDVLDKEKKFDDAEECWYFFEDKIADLIDEKD